ncbi:MAG: hypothetical protein LBL60_02165 [Mycoplasmataceae bacterium]|jgi:uncharacterized membrane protein|nr:hypothetical protein [Mycoplasmataceae bacterium]
MENENIKKLMAQDDEALRINTNKVDRNDRRDYIDAKMFKYKVLAYVIGIVGGIIGFVLMMVGSLVPTGEKQTISGGYMAMIIIGLIIFVVSIIIAVVFQRYYKARLTTKLYEGK